MRSLIKYIAYTTFFRVIGGAIADTSERTALSHYPTGHNIDSCPIG